MDAQLALLFALTFIINMIGSLAYSVRIAGVRTLRIAVSLSLFNIMLLVSRTANSFQAPILAKRVESSLTIATEAAVGDFRWLLVAASLATVIGALLTPTFQRLFTHAVTRFSVDRSLGKLVYRLFSPAGLATLREAVAVPTMNAVIGPTSHFSIPVRIFIINIVATAIWTVGVFASIYAAYFDPELRVTSSNLSGIINGVATILLFVFVDPHLSLITDDVLQGKASQAYFRRVVVWMLCSRLLGTILAQFLLVPAAMIIAALAGWL